MTTETIVPSGGMLTYWQDIDVICNCGESVYSHGSNDDTDTEIITCHRCGQKFKVTCTVEVVEAVANGH